MSSKINFALLESKIFKHDYYHMFYVKIHDTFLQLHLI